MSRRRGANGLVVVGLLLFALLVVADLFRVDSAILGFLDEAPEVAQPQETREQRIMRVLLPGGPRR